MCPGFRLDSAGSTAWALSVVATCPERAAADHITLNANRRTRALWNIIYPRLSPQASIFRPLHKQKTMSAKAPLIRIRVTDARSLGFRSSHPQSGQNSKVGV